MKTDRAGPVGLSAALGFLLLGVTGCALDQRPRTDPLLGNAPAAAIAPATLGAPQPAVVAPPPARLGGAAPSTAALAAQPKPLEGGQGLRIGPPDPMPAPSNFAIPMRPADASSAPPAPGQRVASYEQALALLASRGIKWQRLEGAGADWKFSCAVPNRKNPYIISRTYEGRAPTALAAVQAVIDQIDRDAASGGN